MKPEQKSLRIGAAVILFAVLLRFFSSGFLADLTALFTNPRVSALLLYAGTGRVFTLPSDTPALPTEPEEAAPTEPLPEITEPNQEAPVQAVFSANDASFISITNHPGVKLDIQTLLTAPLNWDLTGKEPTVLIYHTHTSESYENTEGYTPSDPYRTTDQRFNMISIGAYLAQCLREKGISVIHDRTVHDYPSYNAAYTLSRQTVEDYLKQYPTIQLVLDIHRDAYEDSHGNQASNTITVDGTSASRLMVVAGTDSYDSIHAQWRDNFSLAVKLQTVLEQLYPGLCRPLSLRYSTFNQELSPGALLIEVGTAGDTRQEALNAARLLADGIAALAHGSTSS